MPGSLSFGPHLAAPGVARQRGELGALDPLQRLEREARRVAAGVAVPAAGGELGFHLAGAHDDVVAFLQLDFLCCAVWSRSSCSCDGVPVGQDLHAERARHVEEHAAADHLVLGLLDAALLRAGRGDLAAVVAVPHVVLVEDVAEAVPLRAALQRHHHHVVGGADAAVVEHARVGVGAGAQHGVQRIDAAERRVLALRALRAVVVEVERERDHLALAHQARGGDDVLGRGVVQRADLVLRPPASPVLVLLGGVAQIVSGKLALGHGLALCEGEADSLSGGGASRRGAGGVGFSFRTP